MTPPPALDSPLLELTRPLARPATIRFARARPRRRARGCTRPVGDPGACAGPAVGMDRRSEEEVRYGAYRAVEALERAEVEARATVSAADLTETQAARIVAPGTAARWDLCGLLVPLPEIA